MPEQPDYHAEIEDYEEEDNGVFAEGVDEVRADDDVFDDVDEIVVTVVVVVAQRFDDPVTVNVTQYSFDCTCSLIDNKGLITINKTNDE